MKHAEITEKIIGCAMQVHGYLGNGFQEVIYQRSMEIGFAMQKSKIRKGKRDVDLITRMS